MEIFLNFQYGGKVKKVGIDYLSVREYIVSWNSLSIIFLGVRICKFFSRFDYLEKLLSNEYSFIIFEVLTRFLMLHYNYWGKLFVKNSLILCKVMQICSYVEVKSSSPSLFPFPLLLYMPTLHRFSTFPFPSFPFVGGSEGSGELKS